MANLFLFFSLFFPPSFAQHYDDKTPADDDPKKRHHPELKVDAVGNLEDQRKFLNDTLQNVQKVASTKSLEVSIPDYSAAAAVLRTKISKGLGSYVRSLVEIREKVLDYLEMRSADNEAIENYPSDDFEDEKERELWRTLPTLSREIKSLYRKGLSDFINAGSTDSDLNKLILICQTTRCMKELTEDIQLWYDYSENFNRTINFENFNEGGVTVKNWGTGFTKKAILGATLTDVSTRLTREMGLEPNKDYSVPGVALKFLADVAYRAPATVITEVARIPAYIFETFGNLLKGVSDIRIRHKDLQIDSLILSEIPLGNIAKRSRNLEELLESKKKDRTLASYVYIKKTLPEEKKNSMREAYKKTVIQSAVTSGWIDSTEAQSIGDSLGLDISSSDIQEMKLTEEEKIRALAKITSDRLRNEAADKKTRARVERNIKIETAEDPDFTIGLGKTLGLESNSFIVEFKTKGFDSEGFHSRHFPQFSYFEVEATLHGKKDSAGNLTLPYLDLKLKPFTYRGESQQEFATVEYSPAAITCEINNDLGIPSSCTTSLVGGLGAEFKNEDRTVMGDFILSAMQVGYFKWAKEEYEKMSDEVKNQSGYDPAIQTQGFEQGFWGFKGLNYNARITFNRFLSNDSLIRFRFGSEGTAFTNSFDSSHHYKFAYSDGNNFTLKSFAEISVILKKNIEIYGNVQNFQNWNTVGSAYQSATTEKPIMLETKLNSKRSSTNFYQVGLRVNF